MTAPLCEIVCPDGVVRHFPYRSLSDADFDAALYTKHLACAVPDSLSERGECPQGQHTVRPRAFADEDAHIDSQGAFRRATGAEAKPASESETFTFTGEEAAQVKEFLAKLRSERTAPAHADAQRGATARIWPPEYFPPLSAKAQAKVDEIFEKYNAPSLELPPAVLAPLLAPMAKEIWSEIRAMLDKRLADLAAERRLAALERVRAAAKAALSDYSAAVATLEIEADDQDGVDESRALLAELRDALIAAESAGTP